MSTPIHPLSQLFLNRWARQPYSHLGAQIAITTRKLSNAAGTIDLRNALPLSSVNDDRRRSFGIFKILPDLCFPKVTGFSKIVAEVGPQIFPNP